MPKKIYTPEMVSWVREKYQEHSAPELTRLFSERFKMNRTVSQIKALLKNYGITTCRDRGEIMKGRLKLLTEEQAEFVKQAYKRTTIANITKELNKKFGLRLKESQIRSFTRNHNLKSGRTGYFEKGNESWNTGMKGWQAGGRSAEARFKPAPPDPDYRAFNQAEVGDEVIDTYGYRKRKIAQPNKWEFCHILLWREHHGQIPENHIVRFLDNDKTNLSIDNLYLVSRGAHAVLNKSKKRLEEYEPDVRPVVATLAEVRAKSSTKARRK